MKKTILFLPILFFFQVGFSQIEVAQNEVKLNIANTIVIASVEIGYENFLDFNQSLEAGLHINDRINYGSEKGARNFNTTSFKLGYNFYFGTEDTGSGIYVNPFIKYRTGKFEEDVTVEEDGDTKVNKETNMNSFIIGLGGGYKWNFNDSFVLGPFLNVGRNFSENVKDRFSAIEFNAGFNVGYRF